MYSANKMFFYLLVGFMLLQFACNAQLQNSHWTFGYNARVDFSATPPNGMTPSAIYSNEQCATVSDAGTGQLLFYTDGQSVWNINNQTMPNGFNLFGGAFLSCTQGPLIVPFPEDPTKYYIFTMDDLEYDIPQLDNGLRYTVVDMTQNGGLGDVDPLQKNVFLTDFLSEKMTVVRSEAIRGYWVIVHKKESNQFLAYKVDGCGVDPNPITSNVGTVLLGTNSNFDSRMPFYGSMKANNAGNRIGMPIDDSRFIDFYSFDAATGQLFDPITVEVFDNTPGSPIRKYGCSFSPDGNMFYYTNNISVYQLNLNAYDSLSIATSNTLIATPAYPTFQIEEAIDGKLYVAIGGSNVLDVINSPNSSFCDYASNAVTLSGTCLLGLPARVHERNFPSPPIAFLPDTCFQSAIAFSVATTLPVNQISWNFGDLSSGANNTSASVNPTHLFSSAGNYTVTAIVEFECYTDTIERFLTIVDCPPPPLVYDFEFPNVITPNGDGTNDVFEIANLPENTEVIILNRWGNTVFSSANYQNNWDGKDTSGKELVDGVYTYKYITEAGLTGHGFVHLIR